MKKLLVLFGIVALINVAKGQDNIAQTDSSKKFNELCYQASLKNDSLLTTYSWLLLSYDEQKMSTVKVDIFVWTKKYRPFMERVEKVLLECALFIPKGGVSYHKMMLKNQILQFIYLENQYPGSSFDGKLGKVIYQQFPYFYGSEVECPKYNTAYKSMETVRAEEKARIKASLESNNWKIKKVAKELRMDQFWLERKISDYNICKK